MNGYPVVMRGDNLRALVVGGGQVAARKITALLEAGANVRVVAPLVTAELSALAVNGRVEWTAASYSAGHLHDTNLVFAATNSPSVNSEVAHDARARGLLVNVANDGASGDFFTPATHRQGSLIVAVFTGGVPAAAARIRDHLARALDARLGHAISRLAAMRQKLLDSGDARSWREASRDLIREDFPASVANGEFERRAERWR